jgi:hypothetical protein
MPCQTRIPEAVASGPLDDEIGVAEFSEAVSDRSMRNFELNAPCQRRPDACRPLPVAVHVPELAAG